MTRKHRQTPVFFDPHRRRWRWTRRALDASALVCTLVFGIFAVSVLINPVLPSLGLADSPRLPRAHHLAVKPAAKSARSAKARATAAARPAAKPAVHPNTQPANRKQGTLVSAFLVSDDSTSLTSLKQNHANIDLLFPVWFHLGDDNGGLVHSIDKATIDFLSDKHPGIQILPLLNNFDRNWESRRLATFLARPAARAKLIASLVEVLQRWKFAGVNIDFESVPVKSQPDLLKFMTELGAALHPLGLKVTQDLPVQDLDYDYKAYAAVNDYVVLMDYDQHWRDSQPGPIAAQEWFVNNLRERAADVPPEKTLVALGAYGYDWQLGGTPHAKEVSFQEAIVTAQESEGNIILDDASLNPYFEYYDEKDRRHELWFLDGVSTFNQVSESEAFQPRGYALWRLGTEDPTVWSVLSRLDRSTTTLAGLRHLTYGYDVVYDNDQGEILSVMHEPQPGERSITFDEARGLITGESYTVLPSPYLIRRYGAQSKKIAITFDDGPDPQYTPAILDILKSYHVQGTFFIIGSDAEENLNLLRRIVDEGNEVGNHTFTHPNIAEVSSKQFELELTSVQRLFESELGRQTLLFRPPYAVDSEPDTPDEVVPLMVAEKLGYKTVGDRIDPKDWDRRDRSADRIVKRILDDADKGNIILLHDGGGDRSSTVLALPRIITELRSRGYELVPVSALLGKKRDDVMPLIPTSAYWQARVNRLAFDFLGFLRTSIHNLFLIGIILGISRLLFIGSLALWERRYRHREPAVASYQPRVSILVPAFNEERVIVRTVRSLLDSDYPNFDVWVIDDGSQDRTFEVAESAYAGDPRVTVLKKANGGKAETLNYGLARIDTEIVIALDADTVFRPSTVRNLVRHFVRDEVGAVAGNAKVGNRINLVTRWQALEYITSQNLERRAFDALNCITVVPGAVGAWRTELVKKVGGFPHETLAEDADLTITIRRMGYRIVYDDAAIALTEAPDTVSGLIRQRFRWSFGTLQTLWKHRDTIGRRRYGTLGSVALPNVLIFQILFPLISPLMDLLMLESLCLAGFDRWQHPDTFSPDFFFKILFYYVLFIAVDYLSCVLAFALEKDEDWKLLVWLFWQRFWYRQIMYYVAFKSVFSAWKGVSVGWGKLERKATVHA